MVSNARSWHATLTLGLAVVIWLCFLPGTALGQSDQDAKNGDPPPPPPPPVAQLEQTERSATSASDPLDYKPELDETYKAPDLGRGGPVSVLTFETLGGLGGMLGGTFAVGLLGTGLGAAMGSPDTETLMFWSAVAGFAIGPAVGVTLTGDGLGGNGSYLAAQTGSAVGTLGGLLIVTVSAMSERSRPGATAASVIALPVLGSIVGYELSNSRPFGKAASASSKNWNFGVAPAQDGQGGLLMFGKRW